MEAFDSFQFPVAMYLNVIEINCFLFQAKQKWSNKYQIFVVFATKLENLNIWIFFSTGNIRLNTWLIISTLSIGSMRHTQKPTGECRSHHINYSGINMFDYGQPVSLQYTKVPISAATSSKFQTLGPVVVFWTSSSSKILNLRILWRRATGFTCFLGAGFESIMHLPEKRFNSDDPASSWTTGAASAKRIPH